MGQKKATHFRMCLVVIGVTVPCYLSQVWDWDPETGRQMLLVDCELLQVAHDNTLHQFLDQLLKGRVQPEGAWPTVLYFGEWSLYLFLETLKIMLEILL